MGNYIFWTFILAVVAVLSVGIVVFMRAYTNGTTASGLFFKPRSERRLEIVEHASLDGRRKLVLIRRDDVEHLLMTGGPVDVVVETGISSARKSADAIMPPQQIAPRRPTIFGRSKEPADRDTGTREL